MNKDAAPASPSTLSTLGVLLSLGCAACVGAHVVLNKLVLGVVHPFVALACMSLCSVGFSLIPFFARREIPRLEPESPRRAMLQLLGHCVLAVGGMVFTWTGLMVLTPTITSFVGRFEVVVSVLCSMIFLSERMNLVKFVGFVLGVGGVLVLSFPGTDHLQHYFAGESQRGIVYVLIGAVCYGSCEIFTVKSMQHMTSSYFVLFRSLFNLLLLALIILVTGTPVEIPRDTFLTLGCAAFLGPFLGRQLFMGSLKLIPLSISVGLNQTQPLFAALVGCFFMMELPSEQQWVGGLLIVAGCLFLVRPRLRIKRIQLRRDRKIL